LLTLAIGSAVVSPMSVTSSILVQYAPTLCFALYVFAARRVRLSNDVEENPGPVGGAKGDEGGNAEAVASNVFADSIKQLELSLQQKLDTILSTMQVQADTMKRQEDALRRQEDLLKQFGVEQEEMKKTVNGLCSEVADTKKGVQRNERCINNLNTKQDELLTTVSNLEMEIDRLEGFSRRNNIKLFGIPEEVGDTDEDCAEAVRNVLQTYVPENEWSPDVIERAHRLGKPNPRNPNPRPIIAKFQRWGDAMRLMKDREARADMQNDGLRAAQDLTRRQSMKLKQLRDEGKTGYYVNGRLRTNPQVHPRNNDHRSNDRNRHVAGNSGVFTNNATESPHDETELQPINTQEIVSDVTAGSERASDSGNPMARDNNIGPLTRSASRAPRYAVGDSNKSKNGAASVFIPRTRNSQGHNI